MVLCPVYNTHGCRWGVSFLECVVLPREGGATGEEGILQHLHNGARLRGQLVTFCDSLLLMPSHRWQFVGVFSLTVLLLGYCNIIWSTLRYVSPDAVSTGPWERQ